ncbi:MAG: AAA family ATPase, partial [Prevotella sp.]
METVKQIPYGVADFESVIDRGLYYVDKTMYLAELEKQPDALIFIRPRRFGKSLFISMMRAYYDKSKVDCFDKLFGSLWIGSHPTPLRNHYQVLYLDFSRIGGNIDVLEKEFDSYCCIQLNDFIDT